MLEMSNVTLETADLIWHFRASLSELFTHSTVIRRQKLDNVYFQSAPVQSRFANMAVNEVPMASVSPNVIAQVSAYFSEKGLRYTWVVNEDDKPSLKEALLAAKFEWMLDIEGLHFFTTQLLEPVSHVRIVQVALHEKEVLRDFIFQAFEGAMRESVQLFVNEVYLTNASKAEAFFAYLPEVDTPVGYGTINYDTASSLARLSGAATLASYRGRGVYKALLTHRINRAMLKGKQHLVIDAMAKTSAPLCKKFGFKQLFSQQYYMSEG